jgi:uncharacterized protein (DUF427 family)
LELNPMSKPHEIHIEQGSQHVSVEIDGVAVADTRRALLLFEGRLPTRYYIPRDDLRTDLLLPSGSHTHCPWKGDASYFSARVGEREHRDVAWYYAAPLPAVAAIKDHVAFYNDRVEISLSEPHPPLAARAAGPGGRER